MVNLTVKVPDREFTATMEEFLRRSKRAQKDGVNARMLDVIIKAYQNTKIASRAAIESKLGAIYEYGRILKSGVMRRLKKARVAVEPGVSLAYKIIQKRFHDRAGLYLPVAVAKADAVKMIRSVLKSIAFMRSGFIPGLKRFNTAVKGGAKTVTAGLNDVRGRPKGYAYPATSEDNPTAEIGNTTKVASEIAGPALERAIQESKAWMESRMKEDAEKVARSMEVKSIG